MIRPNAIVCMCLILVFAGCGDDGTSYVPCTTDADCKADEACVASECKPATACSSNAECSGSRICFEGQCREPECTLDSECGDMQRCENHECVDIGCLDHDDCLAEQYCLNNDCVNDECSTDADCALGKECDPAGFCKDKQVVTCTTDQECQQNELCIEGTCQIPPDCQSDADCPQDMVCETSRCTWACTDNADCTQAICRDGHCRAMCTSDGDCFGGYICVDFACVPPECSVESDCIGEQVRCRNGRCETYTTCVTTADCEANYECIAGICEELPTCHIDNDCLEVCPGTICICKDDHCHEASVCASEAECTAEEDCVGGICVPHLCRGSDECNVGFVCVGGECIPGGDPATVFSVVILTPGGPIRSGQSIQLEAMALNQNDEEVPGVPFDWSSTVTNRASVDADGLLTGGVSEAGDTDVTATAQGTSPAVVSDPVTFTNVLDPDVDTLRVTVVDAVDRSPVAGATVMLVSGATPETAVTDLEGVATFADPVDTVDVHVFDDFHDYVSFMGTISTDLLIPLPDRSNNSKAGGFSGQMTYTGTGSVAMGIAGTSIAGNLVDLNFSKLLGQVFNATIQFGTYQFTVPLPAQMVFKAALMGFEFDLKNTYYVVGQKGFRTVWAMGGLLEADILMNLFGGNIEDILVEVLPYFSMFDHGLLPHFEVFPVPVVQDTNDLDKDEDSTEMIPDWEGALPDLDLAPTQPQNMYLNVTPPANTPTFGDPPTYATTVVLLSGATSSLGLTPLGLTSQVANDVDGATEAMTMKMAPAYGGLQVGGYTVLVMAMPPASGTEMPENVAAVVSTSKNMPTDVSFDYSFLAFPEDASFDGIQRSLTATAVSGATLYRSTIQTAAGKWEVYLSGTGTITYTLPTPPGTMDDLAAGNTFSLDPIALSGGITYEDLVTFNGDDLDKLNNLATAFSHYQFINPP